MSLPTILFVDDQRSARRLFLRMLDPERYEPAVADGVEAAERFMAQRVPEVVITDLRMPGIDGMTGLQRFLVRDPELPVIVVTAFGTVETAVEAMKLGAFDFIRKPFDPSELQIVIERALRHRRLVRENARLRSQVQRESGPRRIVGKSKAMTRVLNLATRVAPSNFPVLILGESGTGKDMLAEHIHARSARADKPFISLNCSAIPENLLESELFGHEKGAFSGANQARAGFFAEADGGTLFLDEIGDMTLSLQPKLLRVLQNGEYYRVGSRKLAGTDIRLICASNRNIEELVEAGTFRGDLFYRINTLRLDLPPLRERPEDIPLLVEHFLARLRADNPAVPESVAPTAMAALLASRWRGNVRELQHAVEHATLVCDGDAIGIDDLPDTAVAGQQARPEGDERATYKEAREAFDRAYFEGLLRQADGNVQAAAQIAGMHRSTLYERLAKLGLAAGRS